MAELHSNLYYKHGDAEVMRMLDALFREVTGDEQRFTEICRSLNPERGEELAQGMFDLVDDVDCDLSAESLSRIAGYSVLHFVHGSAGDEIVGSIVGFLYRLVPGIHAQAWGCGDDDPWEFWFKYQDGEVVREDDEPFMGDDDEEIRDTIYKWWHEGMPEEIREGFLNQENEECEECEAD